MRLISALAFSLLVAVPLSLMGAGGCGGGNGSEFGISPNGAFDTPYGATKVLADVTSLNYITKL